MLAFLFLFLFILFGAHYFLYFSLLRFLPFLAAYSRMLFAGLFLLSVSFIAASFLAHWQDNFLTRALYYSAGFWLGLLVNLILGAAFLWIIFLAGKAFGAPRPTIAVSSVIFLAAISISFFGAWNAMHPRIKNIEISIKNLPAGWHNKKIVHLSDVHLGHIYRAAFAEKIVKISNAQKPEIVVITGDLFDGMDGNLGSLTGPLKNFQAPGGVFFVTGNHETYLGTKKAYAALRATGIQTLDGKMVEKDGLQIAGVGYPERGEAFDLGTAIRKIENLQKNQPAILLFHSPAGIEAARASGIDLQLSGHTHKGQLFPFNFITQLVYRGYDNGLHSLGDFSIYTSVGTGTWGPPMRTGNTPEITVITLK